MDLKPQLLLHSCCAPCSTVAIERLSSKYDITVYFFNPNIFPRDEYEKRKNEQLSFINTFNTENEKNVEENQRIKIQFMDGDYDDDLFYQTILGFEDEPEMGARCEKCIELRLLKTFEKANSHGIGSFATTLSVSPHKDTKMINQIGKNIAEGRDIDFIENDFKKMDGYKKSIDISKNYGLYRQNYCGCKFSIR